MTETQSRALVADKAEKLAGDAPRLRRRFWPKLKRVLSRIPFADELVAAYYCAMDPATPAHAKAILLGAIAYFVIPADMIPDFIAALGFTDDATVLFAALRTIGANVKDRHREQARIALAKGADGLPDDGA